MPTIICSNGLSFLHFGSVANLLGLAYINARYTNSEQYNPFLVLGLKSK